MVVVVVVVGEGEGGGGVFEISHSRSTRVLLRIYERWSKRYTTVACLHHFPIEKRWL